VSGDMLDGALCEHCATARVDTRRRRLRVLLCGLAHVCMCVIWQHALHLTVLPALVQAAQHRHPSDGI
jgi:hypothetical protein